MSKLTKPYSHKDTQLKVPFFLSLKSHFIYVTHLRNIVKIKRVSEEGEIWELNE